MGKEKAIRTFISVEFPLDAINEILAVQKKVSKESFKGKLTDGENLHLTLKFLGEIGDDKLARVKSALKNVKFGAFEASLGETGTFDFHGTPKIAWISVKGGGIFELQKKIDSALEGLGFDKEERFMSHLTIARISRVGDKRVFKKNLEKINVVPVKFRVDEFYLKSSELGDAGPEYTTLETFAAN